MADPCFSSRDSAPQQIRVLSVYTGVAPSVWIAGWNRIPDAELYVRPFQEVIDSMKTSVVRFFLGVAAAALMVCAGSSLQAQVRVKNRIAGPIRSDQVTLVHGTMHPLVGVARDEGQLSGSFAIHGMSLQFRRSAAQQADLNSLLVRQQVRGSADFHHWLTPMQFAARYGVSQADLQATAKWLQSQGFTIDQIPSSADRIDFSGSASQVEAAFHTQMHRYNLNGVESWANSTDLSVPQALAGMVIGVRHLNSFRLLPSHIKQTRVHVVPKPGSTVSHPEYTLTGQNGNPQDFIAPADAQTIYDVTALYNATVTGNGQYIGIMGQTDITQYQSDIATFRSLSGLSSTLPTQVVVPNSGSAPSATAGAASGDLGESDLDVEWSGAIAKDANIIYVTVGTNQNYGVFDSLQYAIQNGLVNSSANVIPVLSLSYGNCEQNFQQADVQTIVQLEQQANSQGQTVIASAGDSGSADCDPPSSNPGESAATLGLAVDFPGSSPYTTAAGGTSFVADRGNIAQYWNSTGNYTTAAGATNGSVLSYIPEGAWNDSPNLLYETSSAYGNGAGLSAGGGGVSQIFTTTPNNKLNTLPAPVLPSTLSYLQGKPVWQAGPGVPNDGARDVPDVSLAADPAWDGYVVCNEETNSSGAVTGPSCVNPVNTSLNQVPYFDANGSGSIYGGTSISAPQMAAMITLWNQAAGYTISATNAGGVGNANFLFYQLAKTAPAAFHDVVSSSNEPTNSNAVTCVQGSPACVADPTTSGNYVMSGYSLGTGYDRATGLGSVDVAAMAAVWSSASFAGTSYTSGGNPAPDFQIVAATGQTNGQASVSRGSSTNVPLNLTPLAGFTGTIALTCLGPAKDPGITCSLSPATVTLGTSATATLTITAASNASLQHPRIFQHQPVQSHQPWQRLAGGGVAFAALFLMGLPAKRRRFLSRFGKHAPWMTMMLLLLVVCVGVTVGCNNNGYGGAGYGGGGGTGPGTGGTTPPPSTGPTPNISNVVTVTATSGTDVHSVAVAYSLN